MSKMTGDWTKLQAKLNDISKGKVKDDMEEQLQDSANDLKEAMQQYIKGQEGNWQPLAQATIDKKHDDTILIETGEMVDSIKVTPQGEDQYVISATGQRNQEILKYHEYGTSRMVARPVVRPVFEREKGNVKAECKDAFITSLKK
nr:MAG TPA: virion morphogenesis protein [Caudoviricetes sp.]